MKNVNMKTVGLQKSVVDRYNVSKYPHYIIQTDIQPAPMIDYIWGMNGVEVGEHKGLQKENKIDHDVILFLDIDCIPLSDNAIDIYMRKAAEGKLVGNAQRSGHIDNAQHVFAAPSATAISRKSFLSLNTPSAVPTSRGDVMEEYTYAAEISKAVPVDLYMPLRYDSPPVRMSWETNQEPFWRLSDTMPNYGIGTTFGSEQEGDLFYHNFQIFHPGQQERFWKKCESILIN